MQKTFILFFVTLILASCSDEPEIGEEPADPLWAENSYFQFDLKNQYNSHASEDRLFLMGRNLITSVERQGEELAYESALLWLNFNLHHQMPLSDRVFAIANESVVRFGASNNPVLASSDFYLRMKDYDPTFTGFSFPGFDFGEAMSINGQNEVIIPYFSVDEQGLEATYKVLRVQLGIEHDGSDYIDSLATNVTQVAGPIIALHEFDDTFFVTHSRGTIRIGELGFSGEVSRDAPFFKMFAVDGGIVGVANVDLFFSEDGLNWRSIGQNEQLRLLKYKTVGAFSVGFYNSQIFLFEREGETVSITELENAGLEGHEITSISVFGEEVFITTFSGVFQKPLAYFDIPKAADGDGS